MTAPWGIASRQRSFLTWKQVDRRMPGVSSNADWTKARDALEAGSHLQTIVWGAHKGRDGAEPQTLSTSTLFSIWEDHEGNRLDFLHPLLLYFRERGLISILLLFLIPEDSYWRILSSNHYTERPYFV